MRNKADSIAKREKAVEDKSTRIDAEIEQLSEQKIREEILQLRENAEDCIQSAEERYRRKTVACRTFAFLPLVYGLVTTIITCCRSTVLRQDFLEFLKGAGKLFMRFWKWTVGVGKAVAKLADIVPYTAIALIIHWILVILVCVVIVGATGMILFSIGEKYIWFFMKKQADEISEFSGLMILAVTVFAGEPIKSILSINLIRLMIVLWIVYTVIRVIVQMDKQKMRKRIRTKRLAYK